MRGFPGFWLRRSCLLADRFLFFSYSMNMNTEGLMNLNRCLPIPLETYRPYLAY